MNEGFDFEDYGFDIDTGNDTEYNMGDTHDYDFNSLDNEDSSYTEGDKDLFNNTNDQQAEELGINTKKYMIIAVIIAIVLLIAAIFIWKTAKRAPEKETDINIQKEETNGNVENSIPQNNQVHSNSQKDWTIIDNQQDINYTGKTQALFTVTSIEHQARLNGSSLEVRTELNGNISGYTGVYTLYIDYGDGINLRIGDTFGVEVSVGNYGNDSVVGIVYIK